MILDTGFQIPIKYQLKYMSTIWHSIIKPIAFLKSKKFV